MQPPRILILIALAAAAFAQTTPEPAQPRARLDEIQQRLNLTPEQTEQIRPILADEMKQLRALLKYEGAINVHIIPNIGGVLAEVLNREQVRALIKKTMVRLPRATHARVRPRGGKEAAQARMLAAEADLQLAQAQYNAAQAVYEQQRDFANAQAGRLGAQGVRLPPPQSPDPSLYQAVLAAQQNYDAAKAEYEAFP